MEIKKVAVKNLFGYYSYELELTKNRQITIIHAPNGYGKTTVLKLIRGILDIDFKTIISVPFEEFIIDFKNEYTIKIKKKGDFERNNENVDNKTIQITYYINLKNENIIEQKFSFDERKIYDISEMNTMDFLRREKVRKRHIIDDEQAEELTENEFDSYMKLKKAILEVNSNKPMKVNFIDSNRLYNAEINENDIYYEKNMSVREREIIRRNKTLQDGRNNAVSESITNYSNELLRNIVDIRRRFANVSESKERDFPNRLVEFVNREEEKLLLEDDIVKRLSKLESKREELEKLGLVLKGKTTTLPQGKNQNETMLKFYTLYIEDTEEKLRVFDGIKEKLELLLNIINDKTKFSNKKMRIDTRKGVLFEPLETNVKHKFDIPLERLSSGEKHDFILFYELIFKCDQNSIVLIDEPEISLHVAWQMEFINELSKICNMNKMQAIIATHSPDIVNGNDDLLVSLGE